MAPKDLSVPREQSRVFCEIANTRVWHESEKEAKVAQSSVSFELSVGLLGRIPTGSTFSAPRCHKAIEATTFYHFVPHLRRKSFIVKQKLAGYNPVWAPPSQTTTACAEPHQ